MINSLYYGLHVGYVLALENQMPLKTVAFTNSSINLNFIL